MVQSKPFYRIALYSANASSGTVVNAFFQINCPAIKAMDPTKKYQYAIEMFSCDNNTLASFIIDIPTLTQINSYSSATGANNQNALMMWGDNMKIPITFNTIGIAITNIDFLINSQLNVVMKDVTGVQLAPADMKDWCLSIVIWEVQDTEGR